MKTAVNTPAGPMGGSAMMSPRKAMGMGKLDSGAGGVGTFAKGMAKAGGKSHPDAMAKTGSKGAMEDGRRGIGLPVGGKKDSHPMQAAPDHGATHPGGHGMHRGYQSKA